MRLFIARDEDGNLCRFTLNRDLIEWDKSIILEPDNGVVIGEQLKKERATDIKRLMIFYESLANSEFYCAPAIKMVKA